MAAVKIFCETMLFSLSSVMISGRRWMDPKTRLNYCLNEFNLRQPTYHQIKRTFKVMQELGPSHEKMFVVGCYLNGKLIASARGQSHRDAEMGAARRATEELHLDDGLAVAPSQSAVAAETGAAASRANGDAETPLEHFQASSLFTGAMPGWVFRGGDRGTGYYKDLRR